jgi:hypothetical protein
LIKILESSSSTVVQFVVDESGSSSHLARIPVLRKGSTWFIPFACVNKDHRARALYRPGEGIWHRSSQIYKPTGTRCRAETSSLLFSVYHSKHHTPIMTASPVQIIYNDPDSLPGRGDREAVRGGVQDWMNERASRQEQTWTNVELE